ncbi:MAG: M1 family aminopeptidase [Proteobacteria bacterium]|nr:M1 family aminopeptidase [Pseudomonadota bacterium]
MFYRRAIVFKFTALVMVALTGGCGKLRSPFNAGHGEVKVASPLPGDSLQLSEFHRDARLFRQNQRAEREFQVESYALKAHFSWEQTRLDANLRIRLRLENPAVDSIELDSRITDITSANVEDFGPVPFVTDLPAGVISFDLSNVPASLRSQSLNLVVRYGVPIGGSVGLFAGGLAVTAPVLGDPVSSRVVYTASEPHGAPSWMMCDDNPARRAHFAVDFTMDPRETLISNGDLLVNRVEQGLRHMAYETRYELPTYLMAFAQGEFATATRNVQGLPVSIWVRQGIPVDWDRMLDRLSNMLETFQGRLVPYPFEKYALVLIPDFGGGMENAGITFQDEGSSRNPNSAGTLSLTAHELAHQWFGDLVTVSTWDDLWIKEGMATLLAEEATRAYADKNQSGRLFGSQFVVSKGDAIIDPNLSGQSKYTSGPYDRAAWLLTQIRFQVGEVAFWQTLRQVLNEYRFRSIGTDDFLGAFAPLLGRDLARFKKATLIHELPTLALTEDPVVPRRLNMQLSDNQGALVAPVQVRLHGPKSSSTWTLSGGQTQLDIPEGSFIEWDPNDIHPRVETFLSDSAAFKSMGFAFVPPGSDSVPKFLKLSAHSQVRALGFRSLWTWDPNKFLSFIASLASDWGSVEALKSACVFGRTDASHWGPILMAAWETPPDFGLVGLMDCGSVNPTAVFASDRAFIRKNPSDRTSEFKSKLAGAFATDPAEAFATWSALAQSGPTLGARRQGVANLKPYLRGTGDFQRPAMKDLPHWHKFIRELLYSSRDKLVNLSAIDMIVQEKDKNAMIPLGDFSASSTATWAFRVFAVCAAVQVAGSDADLWRSFLVQVGDLAALPAQVRKVVEHPEECPPFSMF